MLCRAKQHFEAKPELTSLFLQKNMAKVRGHLLAQTHTSLFVMKLVPFLFFFSFLLTGSGCRKIDEFQDLSIVSGDAEFAIPLVRAKTTIQDLLENFDEYTFIEITPDGVIHLRYKGDVLEKTSKEILADARSKITPVIPLTDTVYQLPFSQPNVLEVDLAIYKSGKVGFSLESDYVGEIDFTLTIPQAVKNGVPLTIHQKFQSPAFITESDQVIDMRGYHLIPADSGSIYVIYKAITETGERIKLPQVYLLSQNVDFSYIQGYLGKHIHKGRRDTIEVEFFENWIQGDVFFEDPVIDIYIENSFGIPTRSVINVFDILTADGNRLNLTSDFISDTSGIDFVYPSLANVGKTETMLFSFNKTNSNIEDVLGSRPIALDYDVDALTNPNDATDVRGFLTDSSYYKIQVEVDLPLHGKASGFGVKDTFEINFDSYDDVRAVEFKIVADNDMPMSIDAQVYFLEESGKVSDSLFSDRQRIVDSAKVGADGTVISRTTQTTLSNLDDLRFRKIQDTKKLVLEAYFSTYNDGQKSVKALASQAADIRMGMKLKTK
jgi:hypothetical protein